jgi:IMP dehydrogenase/GMP reductase
MSTIKFDFNNILIVPNVNTDITSRYKSIVLPSMLPLFTAPMDTVVDLSNKDEFIKNKIQVVLPRTVSYGQFLANEILSGKTDDSGVFVSLGLDDMARHHHNNFKDFHKGAHILIDVANGHMQKIVDIAREVRRLRPDIILMVGNIANPETYAWYAKNNCVDYIRVGIGNGNGCLTSKQSGVGYPIASLIEETYKVKQAYIKANPTATRIPAIVADGGMKDYVDIIKSLALGADYVMIGSIFNKAFESCADNYVFGIKVNQNIAEKCFRMKIPVKKHFRGMSTKEAQKAMGKTRFKTSEGVVRYRKVEYHLQGWVENFEHYLRNAMSYANAKTLQKFIGKADVRQITKEAYDRLNK